MRAQNRPSCHCVLLVLATGLLIRVSPVRAIDFVETAEYLSPTALA
jgi:hypothetical protein